MEFEKDRNFYAKSHNKISPMLMNVFVTKEYAQDKNIALSSYDCKYLQMILPQDKLGEMKKALKNLCR